MKQLFMFLPGNLYVNLLTANKCPYIHVCIILFKPSYGRYLFQYWDTEEIYRSWCVLVYLEKWPEFYEEHWYWCCHFCADFAFFGVFAPPFFLGVETFLSQSSHNHRPVGMLSIPTQKVWYPRSHWSQNIISSSWWGCWHTVHVLHSIHCQW